MRPQCRFACLTYHIVGTGEDQYVTSESQFRQQLSFLTSECYRIDDFEGLETMLTDACPVVARCAVLTIDDGHESSMRVAELLAGFNARATFFLTRDRSRNKPNFIRATQIRELRRAGFSLGAHGTTHKKLSFLPSAACAAELSESKQWLEDILGEPVRYMAAPGGYINRRVLRQAYAFGYTLVATCRERMNSYDAMTLPGTVNRVNVRRHFSINDFRKAVHGHTGFYTWRQIRSAALLIPKQVVR
jgi:peptidoglycan/xylan/chitin deacetylase (PgdA/CDA1 family)